MTAIIKTNNLSKVYKGEVRALDNLNLEVKEGEIFGYLGPNGAGKTTTIRLLLDLIRPTEGSAQLFGQDANKNSVELHKRIGFLPGELSLWRNESGERILKHIANVRGDAAPQMKEARNLAERLKFDMSKKFRDYSSGNKRKLGLIIAAMHKPKLLILDEPTSGLDPLMQQTFNQMMQEVRAEGRTVFLSSHVLSEVQTICDRVGILRDGKLEAVENVERLTHAEFRHVTLTFDKPVPQAWQNRLENQGTVEDIQVNDNQLRVKLYGDFDPLFRAVSDGYIQNVTVEDPSLEEIFLTFYGGKPENEQKKAMA